MKLNLKEINKSIALLKKSTKPQARVELQELMKLRRLAEKGYRNATDGKEYEASFWKKNRQDYMKNQDDILNSYR